MFAPAGLGSVDEGYNEGAVNYWRTRMLENSNAADKALGNLFMQMQGGQAGGMTPPMMGAPGSSPMPMAPPQPPMMPPQPGAPNGGMPPGGAGGMPPGGPGAPNYPRIPYTGQPGPPMQLGPPGMPSGPPGAMPLAGGPPPGFVNPSRVGPGPPNNLTGPPNIPPGGFGPMGPGGPAGGGPTAPPAGPQPRPPMGMPGTPASMPRMGSMGWEDLAQRIVRANPGAPPEVIAQAMNKAAPFMTAQAQQDWRYIELELMRERNRVYEESVRQRPGIAAMRPEVQLLDRFYTDHAGDNDGKGPTAEQAAEFMRSSRGGGASRETPAQTALKAFMAEGPKTAQEIQDFTNQPAFIRQDKAITAADERARAGRESREGIAGAGREATGERAAAGRESREGIAAAGRTSREGIAGAGREAAAERQRTGITAAGERQQTGIAAKQAPAQQAAKSVSTQIDSIINDITDSQAGGAVTGFQGRFNRGLEWLQGTIDKDSGETRASVFQTKVQTLQAQIPRLLAGVGRISAEERANIDNIVRGLGAFTDPKVAIESLKYLKEVIASKTGTPPAAGGKSRTSQQPADVPPIEMLKEGVDRDLKAPDGTTHTWTLRNGEPVEVRGGQGASPFDQPPAAAPPEKHGKNINPTMKAGRDAAVDYIMRASERTATTLMDIVKDPMSMVGGTELGTIPKSVAQGFLKSLVEGKTINQVSRETGYAVTSIRQIADRAGVKSSGKQFGAGSSWTPEKDALVQDRLKEGKTYEEIAKELGISRNAVAGRVDRKRSE